MAPTDPGVGGFGAAPWNAPPEDARVVDFTSDLVMVGPLATGVVLTFEVPLRLRLVVVKVGFGSLDPTDLARATFSAKVGSEVLEGYHYLPATIGYVDDPSDAFMMIDRGKTLSIEVTNNFPLLICWYQARIYGWLYYPGREVVTP